MPLFQSRARRRLACALVYLACGAFPLPAQTARVATVQDTSAIVVECRIGDVASQVVEARLIGDTLLLPVRAVLELAGLDPAHADGLRSLDSISELLRAETSFDASSLVVQIADSGTLPVSRRAAHARTRAQLRERARASREPSTPAVVNRNASSVTLDYALQQGGSMSVGARSQFLGGVIDASIRGARRGATPRVSWSSTPHSVDAALRVRVGELDEFAGGIGVLLTNAPLQPSDSLSEALSFSPLPAGSEAELFEDGVLVAADSSGAGVPSALRLTRRRGAHVMRLVTYDSMGVSSEQRWMMYAPDALLPGGSLEYVIGVGRCAGVRCAAGTASVAYAPSHRVTVRADWMPSSVERTHRSNVARLAVDASVGEGGALSVWRSTAGEASAVFRLERGTGSEVALRSDAAGTPSVVPVVISGIAVRHRLTSATASFALPRNASMNFAGALGRDAELLAAAATVPASVGVLQGGATLVRSEAAIVCGRWNAGVLLRGTSLPRPLATLRAAVMRLTAVQRLTSCGDAPSRGLLVALPMIWASMLELSVSWRGGARHPNIALSMRRQIGSAVRLHAGLADAAASRVASSDVAGSIVVDGLARRVTLRAASAASSAGLHGIVYVDENGDGVREAGEEAFAGAIVRCGDRSVVSDERGVFALSDLSSERTALVTVDSLSVEDAELEPELPRRVVLTPGAIVRVDIPLQRRRVRVP